jgi:hypothetical protein
MMMNPELESMARRERAHMDRVGAQVYSEALDMETKVLSMETSKGTDSGTAYCAKSFQAYYACMSNNNNDSNSCPTETLKAQACGCVASLSARIACEQPLDQARDQLPNLQAFQQQLLDKCRNCVRNVMAGKSVPEPIIPNTSRQDVERALKRFLETGKSDTIPSLLLVSSSNTTTTTTTAGKERSKSFWQTWLQFGK